MRIRNFEERRVGFERAMAQAGLEVSSADLYSLPPTIDGAHTALRQQMETQPLQATAYVSDMDFIAIGAMQAMADLGIRCGQDVALLGFDDIFLSSTTDPALSTVHVYTDALGSTAVRRLSELINHPEQLQTHIAVETSLTLRLSVQDRS